MKKFILNIGGFVIVVLFILHAFKSTLPFYWANEEICDKMELFNSDEEGFDLVYFGPSAVKREFIPSVFESSLKKSKLRAFNFGTAGVYYAEESFLVRQAMKDEAFQRVEYVLSFGQDPKKIMDNHFHKLRIKYALDWNSYTSCLEYFYWKDDYQQVYRYTIMFLENQLLIGEIFEMIEWHFKDYAVPNDLREFSGYVPYEWSVKNLQKSGNQHDKFLEKLGEDEYMPGYRKKARTKNGIKESEKYELVIINDLLQLTKLANNNGMHYAVVYEPNMNEYIKIEGIDVIYFGDGRTYSEYFDGKNRWDFKHLNHQGATMHSELLANLFEQEYFMENDKNSTKKRNSNKNDKNKKNNNLKKKKKNEGAQKGGEKGKKNVKKKGKGNQKNGGKGKKNVKKKSNDKKRAKNRTQSESKEKDQEVN